LITTKPLYLGLAATLQQAIDELAPNSLLPTEQQLARRYAVSRVTVRLAIAVLERAGLVTRQRGRGTTVNPPKITRHIVPATTLEQDLQDQGLKVETEVLSFEPAVAPPPGIQARLRLQPGDRAGRLRLVRRVHDMVIGQDDRYLPAALAARFEPELIRTHSVQDVLQDLVDEDIATANWETEITAVGPEMAEALRITPGSLIFLNTFLHLLVSGEPVEAGVMGYRLDRVKFVLRTSGNMLLLGRSRQRQTATRRPQPPGDRPAPAGRHPAPSARRSER
jgi:GntR family transcriptional regulator